MRKTLLASTAALLASIALVSAQNMPSERSGGATQSQSGAAAQGRGSAGAQEQGRQGAQSEERGQERRDQTTGQREREQGKQTQRDQSTPSQSKQGQAKEAQGKEGQPKQGKEAQGKQGSQSQERGGTVGQSPREGDSQRGDRSTSGQGQRDQQAQPQQGQQRQDQQRQDQQRQQSQEQQQQGRQQQESRGSVTLTNEQRTRIRQSVLSGRNVPRVDEVNFSLRVGTVVPTRVRLVVVPSTLIEIHPEWRGHEYFVVRDEIVIVDRNRHIVAIVPVGPTGAQLDRGGATLDLSADEIREIQLVLIRRGFAVEADGVFGPRTREALIRFQRQQGLEASGQIDSRTVTALGVSIRGQQGGQGQPPSSTTGQGGAMQQEPPADRGQSGTTGEGMRSPPRDQGAGRSNGQGNQGNAPSAPQNRPQSGNAGAPAQGGEPK